MNYTPRLRKVKQYAYRFMVYTGILLTALCFTVIAVYLLYKGLSSLSFDFLFGVGKPEGESLLPTFVNTLIMVGLTLLISVPIGVGSAIYLNEYAKPGSKIVATVRLTTETLAGIPSIIFGLFGFLFFVLYLKWSWSILAGVFTLAIMVLPTIMRSTEEALKAVPDAYREGSFALGVGKFRTIMKIILPSSISGILVAIILSTGRIVGETAALILTAGTVVKIPKNLFNSGATLSVFMYSLTSEGVDFNKAYGVAIVLLITVFLINLLAKLVGRTFKKG